MEPTTITMRDVRAAHMCSRGAREFFERHRLDWATFLKDGVPIEVIEAIPDAMAQKVVEVARGRK